MKKPCWSWISRLCARASTVVLAVAAMPAQAQIFTVLHSFTGSDGATPYAGLVRDAEGNLYGTTSGGGAYSHGTAFKLNKQRKLTVLHSFNSDDGAFPTGQLIRDSRGNLYGTAFQGGIADYGVVFKLNPAGKQTTLYRFTGGGGRREPLCRLTSGRERQPLRHYAKGWRRESFRSRF